MDWLGHRLTATVDLQPYICKCRLHGITASRSVMHALVTQNQHTSDIKLAHSGVKMPRGICKRIYLKWFADTIQLNNQSLRSHNANIM